MLCLLFYWSSVSSSENDHQRMLFLIDQHNRTFLFRGKIPIKNGKCCFAEMRHHIQDYLTKLNRPISADFKLISISL